VPLSQNSIQPSPLCPAGLTSEVVLFIFPQGMATTVTLGGDVFGRGRSSSAVDLPFGERYISDLRFTMVLSIGFKISSPILEV
jgi:hypothetical protein